MELEFNNVSVATGGKTLLSDAFGSAVPGELMAIMGPSGMYARIGIRFYKVLV